MVLLYELQGQIGYPKKVPNLREFILDELSKEYSFEEFSADFKKINSNFWNSLTRKNERQKIYFGMIFDILKGYQIQVKQGNRYVVVSERIFEKEFGDIIGTAIHNSPKTPFKVFGYSCNTNGDNPMYTTCNQLRETIREHIISKLF